MQVSTGCHVLTIDAQQRPPDAVKRLRVEVSSDMLDTEGSRIDSLIQLAFETLAVHVLDLRVLPAGSLDCAAHAEPMPYSAHSEVSR